jgi:uncharacterized membrane protein YuzA (DUF378 family)
MAFPIFALTDVCGRRELLTSEQMGVITLASGLPDCIFFITSLVLGILGILGIVAMPPAAAYGLVGFSGVILLLWCTMIIKVTCSEKPDDKAKSTKD